MKSDSFKVIFTGQLNDRLSVDVIRNKLRKLLNQNQKKLDYFFNGKPFVIKKNIDLITAKRYKTVLEQAGAACMIKHEKVSDNLKTVSNKNSYKILKLNMRKINSRLSPLTCNLITSTSRGIKIHRPEKEIAEFSEILSVAVCSQTGDIKDLQILFFIKNLKRPITARPVNIRFSDFCNNTAISSTDSIKQFINYLCKKCPSLVMDNNTYNFISAKAGNLPKENPNRLMTAMWDAINPKKNKQAPIKPPVSKNQDLKKLHNKSPQLSLHGHKSHDKPAPSINIPLEKVKPATITSLETGLFALIILIGFSCIFWYGYNKYAHVAILPSAVNGKKDLIFSQFSLLQSSFHVETKNLNAINKTDKNIRQLIDVSKSIIDYLDKNKIYIGDEYSFVLKYTIAATSLSIIDFSSSAILDNITQRESISENSAALGSIERRKLLLKKHSNFLVTMKKCSELNHQFTYGLPDISEEVKRFPDYAKKIKAMTKKIKQKINIYINQK